MKKQVDEIKISPSERISILCVRFYAIFFWTRHLYRCAYLQTYVRPVSIYDVSLLLSFHFCKIIAEEHFGNHVPRISYFLW